MAPATYTSATVGPLLAQTAPLVPPTPLNLAQDRFSSPHSLRFTWSLPASPPHNGVRLFWRLEGGPTWLSKDYPQGATWGEATGLIPNTDYEARAATIAGTGASQVLSPQTASIYPDTIVEYTGIPDTATAGAVTRTSVTVHWTDPLLTAGGYELYYRVHGNGPWSGPVGALTLARSATINGLTPGTSYDVRVYAWRSFWLTSRYSDPSPTVTLSTAP